MTKPAKLLQWVSIFVLAVAAPRSVAAAHAVPNVYTDWTLEIGQRRYGIVETQRTKWTAHASTLAEGRQVVLFVAGRSFTIPLSLLSLFVGIITIATTCLIIRHGLERSKPSQPSLKG